MMPSKVILLMTLSSLLIAGCSTRSVDIRSGQPVIQFEKDAQTETPAEQNEGEGQVAPEDNDDAVVQQENIAPDDNIAAENIVIEVAEPNVVHVFSTLENKAFSAAQLDNQCLRTFDGHNKLAIGDCDAVEDAGADVSMTMWQLVPQGKGYYFLQNKYALDNGTAACLKSVYASVQLEMDKCEGTPTPKNYTSKRLWKVSKVGEHLSLENKYRKDLVSNVACLGVAEDKKTPVVVACNAGDDAERLWKFEGAF